MPEFGLKVPAIEKLIDYGASGVGAIAGPLLAPWKASREGKARLNAAEADAQVRQIQARADASALNIVAEAQAQAQEYLLPADTDIRARLDITPQDIAQSIEFQGRKRLANAKTALVGAADELEGKEVDDHEPDPDWTARFFDCVQDVSSEDMQKIWAKILAGEVESPGRTSLRTLDTLRNLTKADAEMFCEVCNFVLFKALHFIIYEREYIQRYDALRHINLVHLQDCGLLNFGQSTHNIVNQTEWYEYQGLILQVSRNTSGTERIPFQIATLTIAGAELYKIVQPELRFDYIQTFARILHSKNCGISYSQIINRRPDGGFEYLNSFTEIEPGSDDAEEFSP